MQGILLSPPGSRGLGFAIIILLTYVALVVFRRSASFLPSRILVCASVSENSFSKVNYNMNKCRIQRTFLRRVHDLIGDKNPKDTKLNRRALLFIQKWELSKKNGMVFHAGLQVIPIQDTEAILKQEAMTGGMPLSRDGAFNYLKRSYVGFKKRRIMDWLNRVESLQLNKRRVQVARSKPARGREGATNWRMASFNEGRFNLGVDLFDIPREWSHFGHFFVAVLQKTGYTWAIPLLKKDAKKNLVALKRVFRECKALFGSEPSAVTSDKGGEFDNKLWWKFLETKGVKQKFEKKLCSWVEKKNSQFGRTFAIMLDVHRPQGKKKGGFYKALELTLDKLNNTVSRKTRMAAADWKPADFTKRLPRYNRKIKSVPKRRMHLPFKMKARVRQMQKQAIDKGGFYKSYEGMRSSFHQMWSKEIFEITHKKSMGPGFGHKYKINNPEDHDWLPQRELQLIPEGRLVHLHIPRPKKPQPLPKMVRGFPPKRGKMKRGFPPKAKRGFPPKPKGKAKSVVAPRRSTRVRHKPVRYGF